MQRDMELVRAILLTLEKGEKISDLDENESKYPTDRVLAHLDLMEEGGLIRSKNRSLNSVQYVITWDGHDFLAAVRQESTWSALKERTKELGTALPIEILKAVARQVISQSL